MAQKKVKKPSRTEQVTHHTIRTYIGMSDHDLTCRLNATQSTILDVQEELAELQGRMNKAKSRLVYYSAEASGFVRLLASRDANKI